MLAKLLLLFIVVPLVELTLLLLLADVTSWWVTLALVVVTGVVGTMLVRAEGFRTYGRLRQELAQGQMPTSTLIDALFIFVAGALLLTPGMLTDAFGFSLLIPACRAVYRRVAVQWFRSRFHVRVMHPGGDDSPGAGGAPGAGGEPDRYAGRDDFYVLPRRDEPAPGDRPSGEE